MRRAQWSALGLTDEDLEKPKIAIVNSSSRLASCFSHLDEIVAPLKAAIEAAGGVAFEVRTVAAGGPLGLVRDGDMISIDVNARRIDLEVDAGELDRRRAELPPLAARLSDKGAPCLTTFGAYWIPAFWAQQEASVASDPWPQGGRYRADTVEHPHRLAQTRDPK